MEYEARSDHIEKSLETVTGIMSRIAVAKRETDENLAALAAAQTRSAAKHAEEHDDLKEKLHLLYEFVDTWIREHRGKNGDRKPAPGAPPAA
ncbi:MAG: hypothetical protein ACKV2U_10895 [Bryobacteraceae bacterium]